MRNKWFHNIEHLTKDCDGYVYWKDVNIEHYSYNDKQEEALAAKKLSEKCLNLESRGFEPTCCSTVYKYELFSEMTFDSPWVPCVDQYYTVLENEDKKAEFIILGNNDHGIILGIDDDGELICILEKDEEFESGVYKQYHELQGQGYKSCSDRLVDYKSFLTVMSEIGINPKDVEKAIEITSNPKDYVYLRVGNMDVKSNTFVSSSVGEFVEFKEASILHRNDLVSLDKEVRFMPIDDVLTGIIRSRENNSTMEISS